MLHLPLSHVWYSLLYQNAREIEGELDGVSDEHTHTEVARLNGGGWHNVWRPGAGSWLASFGNGGRRCAPLKLISTR